MVIKYQPGGVTVQIGKSQDVSLPPRVLRAHLDCLHFDTDKAFLLPPSIPGIRNIKKYYDRNPGLTVLVNGHTDLRGGVEYNLQLSNERAAAVAAYLQDKVDAWLAWYDAPKQSKRWSYTEDQNMLGKVTDGTGAPYYTGPLTGTNDSATQDAVRRFQTDNGLKVDGQLGPSTRRVLVTRYMQLDGTTLPADATLLTHGCGKSHPIDPTAGDDEGNRRVELFLFEGPVDPAPQSPCPANGCSQYDEWVGLAIEHIDLCKPLDETIHLRIVLVDLDHRPRDGVAYQLRVGSADFSGTTRADGAIDHEVPEGSTTGTLTYDGYTHPLSIAQMEEPSTPKGAQPRLSNLGFGSGDALKGALDELTRLAVMRFQQRVGIDTSGELDDVTAAKLKERYGS